MGSLKIVISGYYGFDNCGDEAVLLSIIHCLKKLDPDVRITVLSNAPEKTRELYGVDVANRWNLIAVAQEILTARLLISGGGSLIQDATSVRSPAYYLLIIRLALFFK
ncbi:MAG: polysaccharide pyruvyl transferase family protein, partial [Oscillospiraceae bacterium]|nr:polysaccharide pyruvyl transferase family protein [Oscillospiraceae bacterium]